MSEPGPMHEIYVGDVLEGLRKIPDGTVRCCSTSPPYWSLRDYGTGRWDGGAADCDHVKRVVTLNKDFNARWGQGGGEKKQEAGRQETFKDVCERCGARRVDEQIGLEQTPAEYVARIVDVFREVRRVLTLDGTVWLNLGDSYTASCSTRGDRDPKARRRGPRPKRAMLSGDLKPKDLVGIPWRVAFALQDDGWYLRSDIIWAKSACMPESVSDRPTRCHEYIFLLSKSPRYFFDMDAVRERDSGQDHARSVLHRPEPTGGLMSPHGGIRTPAGRAGGGRNIRTVWNINPKPFAGAHFAVQPPAIPRRAILAGTSERGQCPECHAPWVRVVERIGGPPRQSHMKTATCRENPHGRPSGDARPYGSDLSKIYREHGVPQRITTGWEPTCEHGLEPIPDVVLDPFTGSGTTGMVAVKLGRDFVGCELNPEYAAMAKERIGQAAVESGVGGGVVTVDDDPKRAQFTLF